MRLIDFVNTEAIIPELQAVDRNGVIRELVNSLAAQGAAKRKTSSPKTAAAPPRGRRWAVAAALLIGILALATLSEATGVTNLTATVIRIATGEGTLVIEVDDPTVQVSLDAFSPMIPLNSKDSGLPAIVFQFTVRNPNDHPVDTSIAATDWPR